MIRVIKSELTPTESPEPASNLEEMPCFSSTSDTHDGSTVFLSDSVVPNHLPKPRQVRA
jgi:hypothetical protein